ncbi:hypothetical protein B0T25DRAFT_581980 [Lasiosphaeria hispida]|uniref:Protein kinase domain-containing protein n=1 Tax=Lasiosphaeria hispida TaxID=260671 RepID=A0AAJ0MC85_9PEZI|nr:hypothetical protein B0T25DRAFT_581980 [Lasiosphaeria hispida]
MAGALLVGNGARALCAPDAAHSYPVTAGIGPFNASYAEPFTKQVKGSQPGYGYQILPYSYFATAHSLVSNAMFSTTSISSRCATSNYDNCVSYLFPCFPRISLVQCSVKSFHAQEDGLAEARNMRLLKQGLASNHSISLHNVIIEHGQGPSSHFLIIFPRAKRGDLEQFLRGGNKHGNRPNGGQEKGALRTAGDNDIGDADLALALLQQCSRLAGALKFMHMGFSAGDRWVRCAHMDLKPNNIIIFDGDGVVGRWKYCDFGISVFKEGDMTVGQQDDDYSAVGSVLDYYAQMTMNTRARRGGGQY